MVAVVAGRTASAMMTTVASANHTQRRKKTERADGNGEQRKKDLDLALSKLGSDYTSQDRQRFGGCQSS